MEFAVNLLERLKLDNKKIIFIALASLIIVYIDFSLLIRAQLKGIKESSPKITKLKNDIENVSRDLARIEDLKTRQAKIKEGPAAKLKRIISEEQVPSLLEEISKIGNKNNIKIMQIKPSREPKGKEIGAVKDVLKFTPLLITLDLVCSYHNLGSFLNQIEKAEELMGVDGISIESDPTNYLTQRVNLVLRAYVKK